MSKTELDGRALTLDEDAVWRALMRVVTRLPRLLDADLRGTGLTLAEYTVLVHLSEAPGNSLRINELADRAMRSGSGSSRLIDRLCAEGLVRRERCSDDGRGQHAVLTRAGRALLKKAWPTHLRSARRRVLDHLDDVDLSAMAEALERIAAG